MRDILRNARTKGFVARIWICWLIAGFIAVGSMAAGAPMAAGDPRSELAESVWACGDSDHELCFLDGRFRVSVRSLAEGGSRAARVGLEGGAIGRFSTRGNGELLVRMVDRRAADGTFRLVHGESGVATGDLEIEVTDLVTGARRRFVRYESDAREVVTEALSASAAVIGVTLDETRAATAPIGPEGGALEATDALGTRFRLVVPKGALLSAADVKLTPATAISGLPFTGSAAGAVYIEPAGLIPTQSALLTVTPASPLPRANELSFAFRGLNGELSLAPPRISAATLAPGAPLTLPVHRFGGYGLASGTAADLQAQLARVPSRSEDKFSQRLAGLLLPLRRSGSPKAALPPPVLQLLQQEYTSTVKPQVTALKQGKLEAAFPVVRNWLHTAGDTSLTAKLKAQTQELQAAEIAGAVLSYNGAAGTGSTASTELDSSLEPEARRPCRDVAAASRMYRAYYLLRSRGAQNMVAQERLMDCARFDVKWNTILDWRPPYTATQHQEVEAEMAVIPDLGRGGFNWFKRARVIEDRVTQPECNLYFSVTKTGTPVVPNVIFFLDLPAFNWYDDELQPVLGIVSHQFDRASNQEWTVICTQHYPPGPVLGPFTAVFEVSWSGNYTLFHLDEFHAPSGKFRTTLSRAASPRAIGEKVYNRGGVLSYFEEHTLIQVFFAPR